MISLDEQMYKEKYLKYKSKYIKLKEYQGGGISKGYSAYIFATNDVIQEFKGNFKKPKKKFNDIKTFFDKRGYIIENSNPSLIKLINNNGILTKYINDVSDNIKQNIKKTKNKVKDKVYTPLTLNKQIGIISNLIENIKNESQLIMDNNEFTRYGDIIKNELVNGKNYHTIIKDNIQLIIDNENRNLEYIELVNNYIHSTNFVNKYTDKNDNEKNNIITLADYMLDRNPKISSNDVINSNITDKNINFNDINLEMIKKIFMVNNVHMFRKSVNNITIPSKVYTSHIKHIKLVYVSSSEVKVIY